MSGGHFDYHQNGVREISESIYKIVSENGDLKPDEWGDTKGRGYGPETIALLCEAAQTLYLAAEMAQRVDWLFSGDHSEESFLSCWKGEVREVREPFEPPSNTR
jgi:hypothetical protein